jgi:hypothetical protein
VYHLLCSFADASPAASRQYGHTESPGTQIGTVCADAAVTTGILAAPTAMTSAANLSATVATLNRSVNPNGLATSYYFPYGTNSNSLNKSTAPQYAG